jgi:hypothetical protein
VAPDRDGLLESSPDERRRSGPSGIANAADEHQPLGGGDLLFVVAFNGQLLL